MQRAKVRIQGTVVVEFICECPGHPHNTDTETVQIDQTVNDDSRKEMATKALKDHFGKPRFRQIAGYEWIAGPTFSDLSSELPH